jgi:cytochrome P450
VIKFNVKEGEIMQVLDDLLAKDVVNNPHPYFHKLRSEDPVHWNGMWNGWILTRYKDVNKAFMNPNLSSDRMKPPKNMPEPLVLDMASTFDILSKWMVFNDPPNHTRLRMLVSKAFTPKTVGKMRPFMNEITDDLLDKVESSKKMDVIRDYAFLLPILVISKMLGLPDEDRDLLKQWSDDLLLLVFGAIKDNDRHERAKNGLQQMVYYFKDLIKERTKKPQDDLITALVQANEKEDALTMDEVISTCTVLIFGGHETTTNLISNGLYSLMNNRNQLEKLRDNPLLIDTAIEELNRYEGPGKGAMRIAKQDMEINGKTIKKGQRLLLMHAAANRDPEIFVNPDTLDITRHPNPHLGFGKGIHYCLGAPLARLETEVAINQILKRFPDIRLAKKDLEWQPIIISRALKSLPVVFD